MKVQGKVHLQLQSISDSSLGRDECSASLQAPVSIELQVGCAFELVSRFTEKLNLLLLQEIEPRLNGLDSSNTDSATSGLFVRSYARWRFLKLFSGSLRTGLVRPSVNVSVNISVNTANANII
jgi:hypothetical protein